MVDAIFRYALGEEAMKRLGSAKVLVSGMGAVGMEVAKNLVLAGVKQITLQDTKTATWRDLSAQVGSRRVRQRVSVISGSSI